MTNPRLTVIIASYNSRATIGACLKSLEGQAEPGVIEVLVIDSSRDGTDEFVRRSFPGVKILHFTERKFCGDARNIGISEARGRIVAFIDADCIAGAGWAEAILKAHESEDIAIGGAIANGNKKKPGGLGGLFH